MKEHRDARRTLEMLTWATAILFFVVWDTVLTATGIALGGVEANPTGSWLIFTIGLWPAMLTGKTLTLLFAYSVYRVSPWRYRWLFPATLAFLGVGVTVYNTYIIFALIGG